MADSVSPPRDNTEPLAQDVERYTWEEFRSTGALWAANTVLQWFGWCIVVANDEKTGEFVAAYPARTRWRGFPAESNESGIKRLTEWMAKAGHSLRVEIEE